jgi:hypothetical protein
MNATSSWPFARVEACWHPFPDADPAGAQSDRRRLNQLDVIAFGVNHEADYYSGIAKRHRFASCMMTICAPGFACAVSASCARTRTEFSETSAFDIDAIATATLMKIASNSFFMF